MPESRPASALAEVAGILRRHGVEFIVIGGQAETILGSPRVTYDIDLCYRRTETNLERLAGALREIGPSLRGAPADLPFEISARSLALGTNFTFETRFGPFDLLGWVEPLGDYDALLPRTEQHSFGGHTYSVISLEDLIAVKRHLGRPRDRESLYHLLAIKRIRDEKTPPPPIPPS